MLIRIDGTGNPSQAYLDGNAPNTNTGLVVEGVYAIVGTIDSLNKKNNTYPDPLSLGINTPEGILLDNNNNKTVWYSLPVNDNTTSKYEVVFNFSRETYLNFVSFDLQNVPCNWSLVKRSGSSDLLLAQGVIDNYNPDTWSHFTSKVSLTEFYPDTDSLILVLEKRPTKTVYNFGVRNFITKVLVIDEQDITDVYDTDLWQDGVLTQNPLGFVENYTPYRNDISNIITNESFWKCSPQPVGDAIVYFVLDLGSKKVLNRLYIDPLYSNNTLNLYYSQDSIIWSPVQRDLSLRKGIYELPTINARYLKFEITNLTLEPYDLPVNSVDKTVEVFPDYVDNYFTNIEDNILDTTANQFYAISDKVSPVNYLNQLTSSTIYGNAVGQIQEVNWGSLVPNISNNSANYSTITDPTTSYKSLLGIGSVGSTYSNPGSSTFIPRRFIQEGEHVYKEINLTQTWHQAYFTGIKDLNLYYYDNTVQNDNEEFTDYFLSATNTFISTTSGVTLTSGGYTGSSTGYIETANLKTISQFDNFKIASLTTDWQVLLDPKETVFNTSDLTFLTLGNVTPTLFHYSNYGVVTLTPTNNTITTFIQSSIGGGANLMTAAQASVSGTAWALTSTSATLSGTIGLPFVSSLNYDTRLGDVSYGDRGYGAVYTASVSNYTALITVSGVTGTATITLDFYNGVTLATTLTSSAIAIASSGTNIHYTVTEPFDVDSVKITITTTGTGTATFTNAALLVGDSTTYVAPLDTTNMQVSAVARVFLPATNNGSYRCSLHNAADNSELAYKLVSSIPTRVWVDIEVPYTLLGTNSFNKMYAKLEQIDGQGEVYQIAMLGIFYNPVSYQYSIDNGSTWKAITTRVGDPYSSINLGGNTTQIKVRATLAKDGVYISALSIVPDYPQNAYNVKAVVDYLGDIKVNELNWKRPVERRPLFRLNVDLYPYIYGLTPLMNIPNPYRLN